MKLNGNGVSYNYEANQRWHILGYLAYDLSVMIRTTANLQLQDSETKDDTFGAWDHTVIDLFHRFRSDALSNVDLSGTNLHGGHASVASVFSRQTLHNLDHRESRKFSSEPSVDCSEPETGGKNVEMPRLVEV